MKLIRKGVRIGLFAALAVLAAGYGMAEETEVVGELAEDAVERVAERRQESGDDGPEGERDRVPDEAGDEETPREGKRTGDDLGLRDLFLEEDGRHDHDQHGVLRRSA